MIILCCVLLFKIDILLHLIFNIFCLYPIKVVITLEVKLYWSIGTDCTYQTLITH